MNELERLQLGDWISTSANSKDAEFVERRAIAEAQIIEHFRLPLKHASTGLLAAMRNCPWAGDSAAIAPRSYTANDRPACARWKVGDQVLSPWIRRHHGQELFYETINGPRAGQIRTVRMWAWRALTNRGAHLTDDKTATPDIVRLIDALNEGDLDELEEAELVAGFRCVESREVWHYMDVTPGIEAITCRLCLRMILEAQGPRADHFAEQASRARTAEVEAELNADRARAHANHLLDLGRCPHCEREIRDHLFEAIRACNACRFEWRRVAGGWELLNSTNRGTDAHT